MTPERLSLRDAHCATDIRRGVVPMTAERWLFSDESDWLSRLAWVNNRLQGTVNGGYFRSLFFYFLVGKDHSICDLNIKTAHFM